MVERLGNVEPQNIITCAEWNLYIEVDCEIIKKVLLK